MVLDGKYPAFKSCFDTMDKDNGTYCKKSSTSREDCAYARYYSYSSCLDPFVLKNPQAFRSCVNTMHGSRNTDVAADNCKATPIRDNPQAYVDCVDDHVHQKKIDGKFSRSFCALPMILNLYKTSSSRTPYTPPSQSGSSGSPAE